MRSKSWPEFPALYEINTWAWLSDLSARYRDLIELGSVPDAEWDAIAEYGFDAVWLMGVWERSPAGIAIANRNRGLIEDFRRALPNFHPLDNVGSPYCVRRYVADELIGGPAGLAAARRELARRGVRLVLDFVPNHVAPDHPWALSHPEYFIRGTPEDFQNDPGAWLQVQRHVMACGRDPYFPAWPDVLQLNAFDGGLRRAQFETLAGIAGQCDGVRCDMAMLVENPIFDRTWGARAGERPEAEYWAELIPPIKRRYPDFLLMAEAYWDREWELQQQGFDFCYDKRLYDRLEHDDAESVRLHLCADLDFQRKLVRFIENHDEPRAAQVFSPCREQAAAVVTATLPGARLFHEGQFEGRRVKLPVFLGRRPEEQENADLRAFYRRLLKSVDNPIFRSGRWSLCERTGWPDNPSYQNIVAWTWAKDDQRRLVIVNLSDRPAQARVHVPWDGVESETWVLNDAFSGATYDREGVEIHSQGLYVDLDPWRFHLFECCRSRQGTLAIAA